MYRRHIGVLSAAMLLILASAAPALARVNGPATAHHLRSVFRVDSAASGSTLVSQRTIAGGDRVERWRSTTGATVVAAAAPGSTLSIRSATAADSGDVTAAVTTAPINKTRANAAALAVADYAASGRSPYSDALAVSGDPVWASQVQSQADASVSSTPLVRGAVTPRAVAKAAASIIGSACVKTNTGDGGKATSRVCVVQVLTSTSGSTWYIGDEISGSANDTGGHTLTRFHAWDSYGSGNSLVEWKPTSTVSKGSCSTLTTSVSYGGVGVSSSSTVCPDRLDPTIYDAGFGTLWSGCDHHLYTEGAPSVDVIKNGPTASTSVTANTYIHWDLLC